MSATITFVLVARFVEHNDQQAFFFEDGTLNERADGVPKPIIRLFQCGAIGTFCYS